MTPDEFYANRGSPFGYSPDYDGFHTGQDYPWGDNTPIPSPGTGTVAEAGETDIHGFYVSVWYPAVGKYLQFCHMDEPGLQSGSVAKGTILGLIGDRGDAYGYHLHLAASDSSTPGTGTRVDPVPLVATLLGSAPTYMNKEEEDRMYYYALNSSTDGLIVAGNVYLNAADGPLRALSSLEGSARGASGAGWGFLAQWNGNDIRTLVKIVGLRSQGPAQGLTFGSGSGIGNDGRLTGSIVY